MIHIIKKTHSLIVYLVDLVLEFCFGPRTGEDQRPEARGQKPESQNQSPICVDLPL